MSQSLGNRNFLPVVKEVDTGNAFLDGFLAGMASWYNLVAQSVNVLSNGAAQGVALVGMALDYVDETVPLDMTLTGNGVKADMDMFAFLSAAKPELFQGIAKNLALLPSYMNAMSANSSATTRVGRWMSKAEYSKMVSTGKVQMSANGMTHVSNPADINAFAKQAKKGSVYVEFDVPSASVSPGGKDSWGIINGPGSPKDRLYIRNGLPGITEMPNATNIVIVGEN